uniref:flagellin N-terminal helical domain-containing protein n=1 Tax=Bradyrhizobium sp. SZCCHNPS1003 TaxID=3057330 RepID=UPI0028EC2649
MSGIVLSASVRQNLLSLQSTAQLLATTQNNLSTGKKVNSALDNPTNFFTAQGLDNRASDISNLLDGIGNGVQVLQAANTGITSLQKLVDSAKSIANQVLQSAVGYSTKSNVTSAALTGASATDLLGSSSTAVTGSVVQNDNTTPAAITGSTKLSGTAGTASNNLATGITSGETLVVNGTTFTFVTGTSSSGTNIGIGDSVSNLLSAIQTQTGVTASITAGAITLTPPAAGLTLSGSTGTLGKLGLTAVGDGLSGQTLTVGATGGGTATSITFGLGTGQVKSLNDLNAKLAANNLQATVDSSTGKISITTTNDAASATIGAIGGTSAAASQAFNGLTAAAPVADATAQTQRASLVSQYNNVLAQINTTA